ncbi:DUF58 domain-containing protein [Brevibacillus dissolubilis]|uniref:DUF58 domain-containing protein n=1 Tax=Brevibacillus dissolubilis TaxID=1844116 RepID=UPI001117A5DB|nr:DUF58 domain-containing protein [Brevibacillus dissolubilis]
MMNTYTAFRLLGALFLFYALVSGSWFLWLFGGFFFFLLAVHRWWSPRIPHYVSVSLSAEMTRVMPHTPVEIRVTMQNRSWLPLAFARVSFSLPESVQVEGADEVKWINKRNYVQLVMQLPRRAQVERTLTLIPQKRGVIWLTEMSTEILGPYATEVSRHDIQAELSLLVYPEVQAVPPLSVGHTQPQGNRLSAQRLQDDVTFMRGIRPYAAGDRLKHIDWKASAKTRELQTRQFEYTAYANWVIVGHILPSYDARTQTSNDTINEKTISLIASLATRCRRDNQMYELLLNVKQRGKEWFHLAQGNSKAHHVQVMTHLAKLHQYLPTSFVVLLRRLTHSCEKSAWVIVTPRLDEEVLAEAGMLARRGHAVIVFDTSEDNPMPRRITPQMGGGARQLAQENMGTTPSIARGLAHKEVRRI